jgi:hypothetical protein
MGAVRNGRWLGPACAIAAWGSLGLQVYVSLKLAVARDVSAWRELAMLSGYFTILTNLLVALVLSLPALAPRSAIGRRFGTAGVRTMAAASILLVGLGYVVLLQHLWSPRGAALAADVGLHYVVPVLFAAYWWQAVAMHRLRWRQLPLWTLYPIGYFVLAMARGALTGWYPYPFLDVPRVGLDVALAHGAVLLAVFVAIAAVMVAASSWRQRARPSIEVPMR